MAPPMLLRSAAPLVLLLALGLGLSGSDAFLVRPPHRSVPAQQQQGARPPTPRLHMTAGPDSRRHHHHHQQQQQPPSTALPTLACLHRALAPLALSLLPILAPRPLAPPASAAAAAATSITAVTQGAQQRPLSSSSSLLLADGVDLAAIKQAADAEALAGFGKGQGAGGERLMGLIQPVMRLTQDQEGLFKVRWGWGWR